MQNPTSQPKIPTQPNRIKRSLVGLCDSIIMIKKNKELRATGLVTTAAILCIKYLLFFSKSKQISSAFLFLL